MYSYDLYQNKVRLGYDFYLYLIFFYIYFLLLYFSFYDFFMSFLYICRLSSSGP